MNPVPIQTEAASDLTNAFAALSDFGVKQMQEIGFLSFLTIEALSLASALFIYFLYQVFFARRSTGSKIHRAFPLISISVTTIFIAIQFSLPLSLGLLGALSIVRFRTPIKEPEEIGFLLLVISSALCCATFNLLLLGVLLLGAVAALLALEMAGMIGGRSDPGMFVVSLPSDSYAEHAQAMVDLLASGLGGSKLEGISQSDDNSTISVSFLSLNDSTLIDLSTKVSEICEGATVNAFYARSD